MTQVVAFKKTNEVADVARQARVARKVRKQKRALNLQGAMAMGLGAVAVGGLYLSLCHLAKGIQALTHGDSWESWAMAVVIDLGFVMVELCGIMATTASLRKAIHKWARFLVPGTMILSAAMNSYAFASGSENYWAMAASIVFGIAIPAAIYAFTRIGAAMWLDCHTKA